MITWINYLHKLMNDHCTSDLCRYDTAVVSNWLLRIVIGG